MGTLIHGLGIATATAVIILATVLPFLPGPYDSLAVPLSLMCQVAGLVGLLLVPVGALWLASGHWRLSRGRYALAIAAMVALSVVAVSMSLAALATHGPLLGVGTAAISLYVATRLWPVIRPVKGAPPWPVHPAAFYLLIVPIAVALIQAAVVAPAIELSRNRAVRNSAALIADIEKYRTAHGRYPASLLSLHEDHYKPGVIGIRGYQYEPSGDAYNVLFEQFALNFGTREFVVYNARDEQAVTSHKIDLLELSPAQLALERRRGHYAVHDGPQPHWKYFWFD
jgi:hypothetical protein